MTSRTAILRSLKEWPGLVKWLVSLSGREGGRRKGNTTEKPAWPAEEPSPTQRIIESTSYHFVKNY